MNNLEIMRAAASGNGLPKGQVYLRARLELVQGSTTKLQSMQESDRFRLADELLQTGRCVGVCAVDSSVDCVPQRGKPCPAALAIRAAIIEQVLTNGVESYAGAREREAYLGALAEIDPVPLFDIHGAALTARTAHVVDV